MLTSFILAIFSFQIALPLLMHLGRNRLIFFPSHEPGAEVGLEWLGPKIDAKVVRVKRQDGRRLASYDAVPKTRTGVIDQTSVVLFLHGNAGNIAHRAPLLGELVEKLGTRVFMPDYSGYGGNEGSPSESEVTLDGLAAFDHLVAQGISPHRIVLFGESLGGAVALTIASQRQCAGVILQSTFSSLSSMTWQTYPWLPLAALLQSGSFPNAQQVSKLEIPLLLVHGTSDQIIPFSEASKLLASAPEGTQLVSVDGAGHNDLFAVAKDSYWSTLETQIAFWTQPSDLR